MGKVKKTIAIILVIAILSYIAYALHLLIVNPTDTYIVKQGTISAEETTAGYIIRDEEIPDSTNNTNGIYQIATEGQKVAKDDSIYRYYSNSEIEATEEIKDIDYQIQKLLEQDTGNNQSADIKAIENQIESKIEGLKQLNNYQEITEYKNSIDTLIGKKINFIGEVTENSEIKKLIQQRIKYEDNLKTGSEYIKAPISGIVSYRVDGLEDIFTEDNFSLMTQEFLEEKELKTGQIVSTSTDSGKVIDNFKCYIAIVMDSDIAMEAKVGDSVKLRTTDKMETDAEIVHINEQSGKRTIIFKINEMNENLINHRKIDVNVIWWSKTGLKVPNQAIIEENGLNYVIRNKAGVQTKILVKIERKSDKFSIISSYSTDELKEIGYDEKSIKGYKKINNNDEILVNP